MPLKDPKSGKRELAEGQKDSVHNLCVSSKVLIFVVE